MSRVPQCEDGLHCARQPDGTGICAETPDEGSGCRSDYDCGADEGGYSPTDLFCNKISGECQEYRGEGDDCTYVNPRFNIGNSEINPSPGINHNNALRVDCGPGLVCDPEEHVCVSYCSEGTLCRYNSDCPEDTICNFTQVDNLYDTWALGRCTGAIEQGDPCTHLSGTECETGRCIYDAADARDECGAPLKEVGDDCDFSGAADATCATNYCD